MIPHSFFQLFDFILMLFLATQQKPLGSKSVILWLGITMPWFLIELPNNDSKACKRRES